MIKYNKPNNSYKQITIYKMQNGSQNVNIYSCLFVLFKRVDSHWILRHKKRFKKSPATEYLKVPWYYHYFIMIPTQCFYKEPTQLYRVVRKRFISSELSESFKYNNWFRYLWVRLQVWSLNDVALRVLRAEGGVFWEYRFLCHCGAPQELNLTAATERTGPLEQTQPRPFLSSTITWSTAEGDVCGTTCNSSWGRFVWSAVVHISVKR